MLEHAAAPPRRIRSYLVIKMLLEKHWDRAVFSPILLSLKQRLLKGWPDTGPGTTVGVGITSGPAENGESEDNLKN